MGLLELLTKTNQSFGNPSTSEHSFLSSTWEHLNKTTQKKFEVNPSRKHDKTFMRNSIKKNTIFLQYQRFFTDLISTEFDLEIRFVWFKEMEWISINIWVSFIDFLCVFEFWFVAGKFCFVKVFFGKLLNFSKEFVTFLHWKALFGNSFRDPGIDSY
jgi:hypothetical protein